MSDRRFSDIKGVSQYTTLSRSTIYKKITANSIPYLRAGKKRIVFDLDQIDSWLLNGAQKDVDIKDLKRFLN